MPQFLDLAEKSVPNFTGLKYTSGDLELGAGCIKPNRSVFLGNGKIFVGALAMGFDSSIMTSLNVCPEITIDILESMKSGNISEGTKHQMRLNERIKKILEDGNGEIIFGYMFATIINLIN